MVVHTVVYTVVHALLHALVDLPISFSRLPNPLTLATLYYHQLYLP